MPLGASVSETVQGQYEASPYPRWRGLNLSWEWFFRGWTWHLDRRHYRMAWMVFRSRVRIAWRFRRHPQVSVIAMLRVADMT